MLRRLFEWLCCGAAPVVVLTSLLLVALGAVTCDAPPPPARVRLVCSDGASVIADFVVDLAALTIRGGEVGIAGGVRLTGCVLVPIGEVGHE